MATQFVLSLHAYKLYWNLLAGYQSFPPRISPLSLRAISFSLVFTLSMLTQKPPSLAASN